MKTYWFCEQCQRVGVVEHDEHVDVMSALYLLEDDHREKASDCTINGYRGLRVLNFSAILPAGDVPRWAVEPLRKLMGVV